MERVIDHIQLDEICYLLERLAEFAHEKNKGGLRDHALRVILALKEKPGESQ